VCKGRPRRRVPDELLASSRAVTSGSSRDRFYTGFGLPRHLDLSTTLLVNSSRSFLVWDGSGGEVHADRSGSADHDEASLASDILRFPDLLPCHCGRVGGFGESAGFSGLTVLSGGRSLRLREGRGKRRNGRR